MTHWDPQQFEQAVRRFTPPVFAAAFRQLGDRQLAEDATQAVFLVLHQTGGRIESEAHLAGFLFQSTRYVCSNLRRKNARREHHEKALGQMTAATSSAPSSSHGGIDPAIAAALDDAIAALDDGDRDLVLQRYFAGAEIAHLSASLNIAEPTLRKRLSRAIEQLREHLLQSGVATASLAAVTSTLAATLPGSPEISQGVTAGLLSAAAAKSTAASSGVLQGAAMASAKVWIAAGGLTVAAGLGFAVILMPGRGIGSPTPSGRPTAPTPVVSVTPSPNAAPAPTKAESLLAAGNYGGALRAYTDDLANMSVESYRDKKDFTWTITSLSGSGKLSDTVAADLRAAATAMLADDTRNRDLVDWRVHSLLSELSTTNTDKLKELQLAIDAYPRIDYDDPTRHSKLQHLYNAAGSLIAGDAGFNAGADYLVNSFSKDDRFTFVFIAPWVRLAVDDSRKRRDVQPDSQMAVDQKITNLVGRIKAEYTTRATKDPAHADHYKAYSNQLDDAPRQARLFR